MLAEMRVALAGVVTNFFWPVSLLPTRLTTHDRNNR